VDARAVGLYYHSYGGTCHEIAAKHLGPAREILRCAQDDKVVTGWHGWAMMTRVR